jgi:hypothetical protein
MLEMYASGRFALDATDPRNQFHERALREARFASDYRESASPAPVRGAGLVARLRRAIVGAPAVTPSQPCSCPA